MKKWKMLIGFLGVATNCFAQGIVNFNNNVFNPLPSNPDHSVYRDATGAMFLLTGTQYVAELYGGPDASSLQPLTASISRFRVATTTSPGTWSGKNPVTLSFGGIGIPVTLDVRVWDATSTSSYEEAVLKGTVPFGESGLFTYTQGNTSADTLMLNMPAFVVALIPEPSAVALSILGAIGLLVLRRRPPNREPDIGGNAHL